MIAYRRRVRFVRVDRFAVFFLSREDDLDLRFVAATADFLRLGAGEAFFTLRLILGVAAGRFAARNFATREKY